MQKEEVDHLLASCKIISATVKTLPDKHNLLRLVARLSRLLQDGGSGLNLHYAKSLPEVKVNVKSFQGSVISVTQPKVSLQTIG